MNARARIAAWCVALAAGACVFGVAPAHAQWTRVTALPADWIFSVRATGDTIVAGGDSVAWVSTNGGATWRRSAILGTAPAFLDGVLMLDGRLWAGTGGQGVFTSDDLGATWQARSTGLAGGLFGTHFYVQEFRVRRDTLYAATDGAGVFRRPRFGATTWAPTGNELVASQAGSIVSLATDGARLLAAGGANGLAFTNDGGAPWSSTMLGDSLLLPGLSPTGAVWTGAAWLVGTDHGFYRSATGRSPWTFVGLNYAPEQGSHVVSRNGRTFVAVNRSSGARFLWTDDDGARWQPLEDLQTYVTELEYAGTRLWAARSDGLWWRETAALDVAPQPVATRLGFAIAGAHPVSGPEARVRFRLPAAAAVTAELFDAAGRRHALRAGTLAAGEHEWALDVSGLDAGVYFARLTAAGETATLRLVRLPAAR